MPSTPALPKPEQLLERLTQQIQQAYPPGQQAILIGIHTGGVPLAQALQRKLRWNLPTGQIDVALQRDDFSQLDPNKTLHPDNIPIEALDRPIILVDDILQTGRTIRAALNTLFNDHRRCRVELAVLIDRGGRQLPIQADYCGAQLPLKPDQTIKLRRQDNGSFELQLKNPTSP